jgi:hypothetical protein
MQKRGESKKGEIWKKDISGNPEVQCLLQV